jgi:ribokinase
VLKAAESATGLVCINLAPAAPVPDELLARADLIVVNETEAAFYGAALADAGGLIAKTYGKAGAALLRGEMEIARATPPSVTPVDTTGAGDAFVGALVVSLAEGRDPQDALTRACAAGALATTRAGAQPSFPMRAEVEAIIARRG